MRPEAGTVRRSGAHLALVGAALLLISCRAARPPGHPENPPGFWHVVRAGETLEDIARAAGVPAEDMRELNGLEPGAPVEAGRLVFVPMPDQPSEPVAAPEAPTAPVAGGPAPAGSRPTVSPVIPRPAPSYAGGRTGGLLWPLTSAVLTSGFGWRDGRPHEGIDLMAPAGSPVRAAAAGEVVFAGDRIRGYGNMLVLQHGGDLLTVYAHNARILVKQGDRVVAGQRVAEVGNTGRASAPHLHFEVRHGEIPRDPVLFLDPLGAPARPTAPPIAGGPGR